MCSNMWGNFGLFSCLIRLNWSFIQDILIDIGLSTSFVELVWYCISSPKMKVLQNGKALEEFLQARGICQGDSLSPYLFVLCFERLLHVINVVVDNGFWQPIQLAREGPKLTHLAFTDDLLLFTKADLD